MPVRAIVFDLFDTLVDLVAENLSMEEHRGRRLPASVRLLHEEVARHADVSFDAFADALRAGEKRFAQTHYAEGREVPTQERFTDMAVRLALDDPSLPEALTRIHMGMLRAQVQFQAHHPEVLEALASRVRLGLCSNFSHSETALEVLDSGGLRPHLDAVVISDAFGLRKPRPEIFLEVLSQLDVVPEEVLHVGDSLRADVAGAAACGVTTVWITRRVRDAEARVEAHAGPLPDHVVADLRQLPALLDQLAG